MLTSLSADQWERLSGLLWAAMERTDSVDWAEYGRVRACYRLACQRRLALMEVG